LTRSGRQDTARQVAGEDMNRVKFLEANGKIIVYVSGNNPAAEGDSEVVNTLLAQPLAEDERLFGAESACQSKMAARFELLI